MFHFSIRPITKNPVGFDLLPLKGDWDKASLDVAREIVCGSLGDLKVMMSTRARLEQQDVLLRRLFGLVDADTQMTTRYQLLGYDCMVSVARDLWKYASHLPPSVNIHQRLLESSANEFLRTNGIITQDPVKALVEDCVCTCPVNLTLYFARRMLL